MTPLQLVFRVKECAKNALFGLSGWLELAACREQALLMPKGGVPLDVRITMVHAPVSGASGDSRAYHRYCFTSLLSGYA